MDSLDATLRLYDYAFPADLIAAAPASPRDSAKLLVYRRATGDVIDSTFASLGDFLPSNALLVLNQTKVIPARLQLLRSTGGKVSALFLGTRGDHLRFLANKRLTIGERLKISPRYHVVVEGTDGKEWLLRPNFSLASVPRVLERFGETPLPPYIKNSPLTERERRREYQTVFAKQKGSIAAPTASLHFSKRLLRDLRSRGIETAPVTLHVHLGTFAPLTEAQWKTGALHHEEYSISAKTAATIARAKAAGRPIIAVGTTVVRTLESATDQRGHLVRLSGTTDLFIREGYDFRLVDGLITNFHVPRSSLMMLVSALTGRKKLLELYRHAIEHRYRLFSFGDGMVIL